MREGFSGLQVPGIPGLQTLGNVGEALSQAAYRNGASFWHSDCAAEPGPDAATMLYCADLTDRGALAAAKLGRAMGEAIAARVGSALCSRRSKGDQRGRIPTTQVPARCA